MQRTQAELVGRFRLEEKVEGGDRRYLHVLSIDGAAKAVKASGSTGVEIKLAAGTATIVFDRDSPGATLQMPGGKPVLQGAGVDTWPELR